MLRMIFTVSATVQFFVHVSLLGEKYCPIHPTNTLIP